MCTCTQPLREPALPPSLPPPRGAPVSGKAQAGSRCFSSPGTNGSSCGTRAQGSEGVPAPAGGPRQATLGRGGRQSPRRLGHRARNLPRTFPPYTPTPPAQDTRPWKRTVWRELAGPRERPGVYVCVCACACVWEGVQHTVSRDPIFSRHPRPRRESILDSGVKGSAPHGTL